MILLILCFFSAASASNGGNGLSHREGMLIAESQRMKHELKILQKKISNPNLAKMSNEPNAWETENKICMKKFNLLVVGSKLGHKKVKLEEPRPRPLGHPTWYNYGKRKLFVKLLTKIYPFVSLSFR